MRRVSPTKHPGTGESAAAVWTACSVDSTRYDLLPLVTRVVRTAPPHASLAVRRHRIRREALVPVRVPLSGQLRMGDRQRRPRYGHLAGLRGVTSLFSTIVPPHM